MRLERQKKAKEGKREIACVYVCVREREREKLKNRKMDREQYIIYNQKKTITAKQQGNIHKKFQNCI